MARRRIILVDASLMAHLVSGRSFGTWTSGMILKSLTSDCPSDMRIVGCGWDEKRNVLRLAAESEEWDDVPDGYFAPEFTPSYTTATLTKFEAAMEVLGRTAS